MALGDADGGPWTLSQRRALAAILACLLAYVAVRYAFNRQHVPDPIVGEGPRAAELSDRLDPNVADAAALSAIPTLGEKRAAEIVAYRDQFVSTHPGQLAFRKAEDLMNIKGIGPATVEAMTPYLVFRTESSATRASP